MPTTTDFLKTDSERALVALAIGLGIIWATTYLHEGFHWIFTVPFGGTLDLWHWLSPGWLAVNLAPEPWATIAPYAGGIGASAFLALLLTLVIRHSLRTWDPFWRWLGAPLSFGVAAEAFAGIFEGAFIEFYRSGLFYLIMFVFATMGVIVYLRFVVNPRNSYITEYSRNR